MGHPVWRSLMGEPQSDETPEASSLAQSEPIFTELMAQVVAIESRIEAYRRRLMRPIHIARARGTVNTSLNGAVGQRGGSPSDAGRDEQCSRGGDVARRLRGYS